MLALICLSLLACCVFADPYQYIRPPQLRSADLQHHSPSSASSQNHEFMPMMDISVKKMDSGRRRPREIRTTDGIEDNQYKIKINLEDERFEEDIHVQVKGRNVLVHVVPGGYGPLSDPSPESEISEGLSGGVTMELPSYVKANNCSWILKQGVLNIAFELKDRNTRMQNTRTDLDETGYVCPNQNRLANANSYQEANAHVSGTNKLSPDLQHGISPLAPQNREFMSNSKIDISLENDYGIEDNQYNIKINLKNFEEKDICVQVNDGIVMAKAIPGGYSSQSDPSHVIKIGEIRYAMGLPLYVKADSCSWTFEQGVLNIEFVLKDHDTIENTETDLEKTGNVCLIQNRLGNVNSAQEAYHVSATNKANDHFSKTLFFWTASLFVIKIGRLVE